MNKPQINLSWQQNELQYRYPLLKILLGLSVVVTWSDLALYSYCQDEVPPLFSPTK